MEGLKTIRVGPGQPTPKPKTKDELFMDAIKARRKKLREEGQEPSDLDDGSQRQDGESSTWL